MRDARTQAEALWDPGTISPADRSLWGAIKESGRKFLGPAPMESGLETSVFTEPLADYVRNPPAETNPILRHIAEYVSALVPATRGDVIGAVGNAALMAAPGGAGAAGSGRATGLGILKTPSMRRRISSKHRTIMNVIQDVFDPWAPGETTLGDLLKRGVTGAVVSEAASRAGLKPTREQTDEWARKANSMLGGPDYLDPNYVAPGAR